MSENAANEVQDPAEPKRVETVVETHEAGENAEPAQSETTVETTVTESSDSE